MSEDDNKKITVINSNRGETRLQRTGLNAGSMIDQSLANLSDEELKNIRQKAADEALRLEVKMREQNIDHQSGSRAINDHVDTFKMLEKNGKLTRNVVKTEVKTGAGTTKIESKSGPACYVATAAYGNPNHPDVVFLRQFRDEVLKAHYLGRAFIAWYWMIGPYMASAICWSQSLRSSSKWLISRLVSFLKKTGVSQ